LDNRPVPLVVDVDSVGGSGRTAVDQHAGKARTSLAPANAGRGGRRAWKRYAIRPAARWRTLAGPSTVYSPARAQEFSLSTSGSFRSRRPAHHAIAG
jgi:hypothetical protein